MKYRSGLLLPGETVELRGRGTVTQVRRVGEVVAVERQGIRLRQTLRDFTGDPGTLEVARVQDADGRWVVLRDFRDTREQTVVVFWRHVAEVEVLDVVERAA